MSASFMMSDCHPHLSFSFGLQLSLSLSLPLSFSRCAIVSEIVHVAVSCSGSRLLGQSWDGQKRAKYVAAPPCPAL
jgi:hypothetical protein